MTSATRKALVDVYGSLLKAGWGEPIDRRRGAGRHGRARAFAGGRARAQEVARAIKQLQRLGEL